MSRPFWLMPALALLLALGGCTSPDPTLYTVVEVPGTPLSGGPASVEVRHIGLARYLDRPSVVLSTSGYELQTVGSERWAEPVGDMLTRVLAQDLGQRLPGSAVFSEAGAISAAPAAIVELDVQRMDSNGSGPVVLVAQVSVQPGEIGHAQFDTAVRTIRAEVTPGSPSTRDLVAAISAALGKIADSVAGMLAIQR